MFSVLLVTEFLDRNKLADDFVPRKVPKLDEEITPDHTEGIDDEQLQQALQASYIDAEVAESKSDESAGEPEPVAPLIPSIQAIDHPEPDVGDDVTRVQIKLKDGKRVVRRIRKTDKVRILYEYLKFKVPELQAPELKEFELLLGTAQEKTSGKLDETVEDAGLINQPLLLSF